MDYKDFTALLTKIFGAFMLANVFFFYLPGSISSALPTLQESIWAFGFHTFLPSFIPLVVGLLLMKFPATISNRLLKGEKLSELPNQYLRQIELIAFCVLGLFVLSRSISDLAYYSATYFWRNHLNASFNTGAENFLLSPEHFGNIVSAVIETLFGIWLILGAATIAKALASLRRE